MWLPTSERRDTGISFLHSQSTIPRAGSCTQRGGTPPRKWGLCSCASSPSSTKPAASNVDSSSMYRKWEKSKSTGGEYIGFRQKQILRPTVDAEPDGVKLSSTLAQLPCEDQGPSPGPGLLPLSGDDCEDSEAETEASTHSCAGPKTTPATKRPDTKSPAEEM
ncbi:ubiquitin-conjugating enzyme E2 R1 [Rhinolophus ferrumequinum]|nr:ubiquitin-conjugating enzyme E2 R1 [Rhinolophus ferrumequinum]XP_032964541.1 ubiquitin-conjugating enzyme E2 R1 [Rhinolophus ferrumequinum]XP_032964542.1 ubiquitin-conjugating enzyme E2 R1 [Rhinolophus ferrumequinum]